MSLVNCCSVTVFRCALWTDFSAAIKEEESGSSGAWKRQTPRLSGVCLRGSVLAR